MSAESMIDMIAIIADALLARNPVYAAFFDREAPHLAAVSRCMAERFRRGGRLLAFGVGAYATDAQHVSVEFIHPVIVGKRALPAMDLSAMPGAAIGLLTRPEDMVMGFAPPEGDVQVDSILRATRKLGAMTFALPGGEGDYGVAAFSSEPFLHQEMMEILYHTLWETVHVYLERDEVQSHAGDASFLYPFLGSAGGETSDPTAAVADSIRMKVAQDAQLRERAAAEESASIADACRAIAACARRGGKLLIFGNGGSATDANDLAFDCVQPPPSLRSIPAISLSAEPAVITAIANDVGMDAVFLRQLIAHAGPPDIAIGISTSGGSRNLLSAFSEARRRKMTTIALLGYDGGEIVKQQLADIAIVVRCDYIPRIQEAQASIYHVMREAVEYA
jgi:D-sedoheptulose 7-phosphate isomerase